MNDLALRMSFWILESHHDGDVTVVDKLEVDSFTFFPMIVCGEEL